MKYIQVILLISLLFVVSCASAKGRPDPYKHNFELTPDGWWIMYTNNQHDVAELCQEPDNKTVMGCARWPDKTPAIYPVKDCFIGIYTDDSDNSVDDIKAHELRHCREGDWHKGQ